MSRLVGHTRQNISIIQGLPPVYLAPILSYYTRAAAAFSTSSVMSQRRTRTNRDNNPNRGVSALRRTGLRRRVEMSRQPLPQPVLDPKKRSKVTVDPDHPLWGFFRENKKALNTPEEADAFGRPWVVEELRNKSWEDLHSLWWVCCRERNILATQEYERKRLKAGYGAAENMERFRVVGQTQKAIKHALTERYYAFEEARRVAVTDREVNLDAEPGSQAYTPLYSDETMMEEEYPVKRSAASPESTA
ncbi:MAG: hypothetical protein Q9177_004414 [Variospora cf. flavescens]